VPMTAQCSSSFVGADPLPNEPFVRLDEESFGAYLRAHGGSRRASGASMMGHGNPARLLPHPLERPMSSTGIPGGGMSMKAFAVVVAIFIVFAVGLLAWAAQSWHSQPAEDLPDCSSGVCE
jgi:hypothetical protein